MCASARKMMLRSTDHVCKCNKYDVASHGQCVQVQERWCCVAPTMCASARKMMLRSTDHVCKCKERYHPPPHPTPPHPTMLIPGEPPVPRVYRLQGFLHPRWSRISSINSMSLAHSFGGRTPKNSVGKNIRDPPTAEHHAVALRWSGRPGDSQRVRWSSHLPSGKLI